MTIRILATGALGFIGSHVIEKFSKRKYDVTIVDDLSSGRKENVNTKKVKEIVITSIVNYENMLRIFERIKPDIVLHFAAQPSLLNSIQQPMVDMTTNAVGTMIIARLCQQYGVKKLVYASTSAVMDEDSQSPDQSIIYDRTPSSPYGISKLVGEIYVRHFMTDAIILRLGNVYGERQMPLGENQLVPRAIRYALGLDEFEVYGSGHQTRDYVYVKDVAEAFFLASKSKESGIFYVGTGFPASVWNVLYHIENAFGEEYDWPEGEARDDREKIILDIEPTMGKLGWKPKTSLSKGIERTVKWWKREYEKK